MAAGPTACSAAKHAPTRRGYEEGCRCPETVTEMRRRWRERRYLPGRSLAAPKSRDPHIDEIAVARAMHGDPVTLTVPERTAAVRRLTLRGLTAREIGLRLRIAMRTVQRHRSGVVKSGVPRLSAPCPESGVETGLPAAAPQGTVRAA